MIISAPMIFSSVDSTEYLVSKVDGTMSIKGLNLADVRLLSARFYVLAVNASFALTSGPLELSLVRESHNFHDSNSLNVSWLSTLIIVVALHSAWRSVVQLTLVAGRPSIYYNSIQAFLEKGEKEIEEEGSKRKGESSEQRATKKHRIDEEVEELKTHRQIIPNDEDDVYTEATPLALKVPVVDYQIHYEHNKPFYKIIRADLVQERFQSLEPKKFLDDFMLNTFKIMFEKPNVEANIWRDQRGRYGLTKVKSWKLFESCGVHIITFTTTQMILLVERKYPLTRFTLEQMLNNVRLKVKEESEMSLELLSFAVDAVEDFKEYMLRDYCFIMNGDTPAPIASVSGGAEAAIPPKTTEQKIARRNELKANTIKTKFGGNKEYKKMQKTILKQQYENFASSKYVAMLTMRVKRFIKKTRMNLNFNGKETVGLDKTKVERYNCHRRCHFGRECRAPRSQGNRNGDNTRRVVPLETSANALVHPDKILSQISPIDKTGLGYDSQLNKRDLNNKSVVFESAFDSSVNESEEDNNQANDRYKAGEGYHAVRPPYTRNFMPPRPDLSFAGLDDFIFKSAISGTVTSVHETETSVSKTSKECMEKPKTVRKFVIEQHTYKQAKNLGKSQNSGSDKRNWNRIMTQKLRDGFEFKKKTCFICGSLYHLIKDCNFYENKVLGKFVLNNEGKTTSQWEVRPVWNNAQRVNHQNFSNNLTQPHLRRNFVPTAVITNSGKVPVNTAKQSSPRAATSTSTTRYVNIAVTRPTGNGENVVKSSACWIWRPKRNVIDHISKDSGSYMLKRFNYFDLQDYQEIDGGFVAFGGSLKGGKISRKSKIKTKKLDFKDVYFVKELKFNLLYVSQMCDKKKNVLFIETECLVLSLDFKLLDENQVLLKVPRHNNMYSFDLKNVAPSRGRGPEWLIDIDSLTKFMNYEPVTAGNQTNDDAGIEINSLDDKDTDEVLGKGDKGVSEGSEIDDQERTDSSTQDVNIVRLSIDTANTIINTGSLNINTVGSNDPSMPFLEETVIFDDVYDDRETLVDHPNGKRAIRTKWVFKIKKDERGIVVRNKERLVVQGYTQEEGIDYDEVFAPVVRIEAIRRGGVCVSTSCFFEDPHFPNKVYKVEKALYGFYQAPRAWYKTLSIYLLENGFKRGTIDKTLFIKKDRDDILLVQVYVDDIIFRSTTKSLCDEFEQMMHKRFQMSSMGELTFFLGLQVKQKDDGIFISQDKYVADILKKFDFTTVKTSSTLMKPKKELIKDAEAEDIDVHLYRSMIRLLMYLTTSRPDIMFVVYAYARFQVTPKTSHLHAMKRIFRYIKGQPKLGLWYPRDSPFDLEAFFDSDYTEASLDMKSTIGGCQFLGKRLISWQCKKKIIVANSTTEAEYVADANCCGQQNAAANTLDTREVQITATIDGKVKLVSEAFIRRHLKLEDSDGISNLPNTKIFEQLALMGIPIRQETEVPRPSSPTHTHIADKAASTGVDVRHGWATTTISSLDAGQGSGNIDKIPSIPHDLPLLRVNTLRSDEGSMTLNELTVLCIKLSQKVETLKAESKQTKKVYGAAYTKLIVKVKKLEKTVKLSQVRRRANIVVSDDEELEDPSKQGRREAQSQESQTEDQLGVLGAAKVLAEVAKLHTYTRRRRTISAASGGISTAAESVSTAGASMPVSTVGMVDKGKAIMQESEPELTTTKLQQRQERAGYEAASRSNVPYDDVRDNSEGGGINPSSIDSAVETADAELSPTPTAEPSASTINIGVDNLGFKTSDVNSDLLGSITAQGSIDDGGATPEDEINISEGKDLNIYDLDMLLQTDEGIS
nr:putative ribonuclease H-like domain-containing protein [Tanacetum cinerariifolium]